MAVRMTHPRGAVGISTLALLMLPLLASCQTAGPVGRIVAPSDVEASDPPLNPNPTHVVRLHGRAPETLDFRFRVAFLSTHREGDCWNHAGFWEGGGEKTFAYDIYPVRKGDMWEADLVVDRYLPGRCGWNIRSEVMIIVKPAELEWSNKGLLRMGDPVIGDAREMDDNAPRCEPGHPRCTEERSRRLSNSDKAIPVEMRCKRIPLEQRIGDTLFRCNDFPEHKIMHLLKNGHTRVRIDLYDISPQD